MSKMRQLRRKKSRTNPTASTIDHEIMASFDVLFVEARRVGVIDVPDEVVDAWDRAVATGTLKAADVTVLQMAALHGAPHPHEEGLLSCDPRRNPISRDRFRRLCQEGWASHEDSR